MEETQEYQKLSHEYRATWPSFSSVFGLQVLRMTCSASAEVPPSRGIPKGIVLDLLDDRSDTGCYCTEEEWLVLL